MGNPHNVRVDEDGRTLTTNGLTVHGQHEIKLRVDDERLLTEGKAFLETMIEYTIADEGPGFDATTLPDPMAPENLLNVSGRGVMLIRTFMDEVTFNAKGNQMTMIKRLNPASYAAP